MVLKILLKRGIKRSDTVICYCSFNDNRSNSL